MSETSYVQCPFCKEGDFDLPGLKYHFLMGYCAQFEETEEIGWRRAQEEPPVLSKPQPTNLTGNEE